MATTGRWHGPAALGVVIVAGVALLVTVTVVLYPSARTVAAPRPGSGAGVTATPVPTQILTDDEGCQVDLSAALDRHLLCVHDLGAVWQYDHGLVAGPPTVLCIERTSVFGQVVPDPFPRFLDDGRRQVSEWLRVYPTEADAAAAYVQLMTSPPCGAESGARATQVAPLVAPLDSTRAQGFEITRGPVVSDVMLIQVGRAVVQTSVTPLRNAPHDPDVVQLVAQVAVTRYLSPAG